MIFLDTDHVSILQVPDNDRRNRLLARIDAESEETFAITIVTVEEQMRGWLASIAKERHLRRQRRSYRELKELFAFFSDWEIVAFDDESISTFEGLQVQKIRIGTMDLKIAAIALAGDALLLTANKQDFEQVPGLRFENWMDPS
jgi:tRNA(fMet)-specific endonuclease VapC